MSTCLVVLVGGKTNGTWDGTSDGARAGVDRIGLFEAAAARKDSAEAAARKDSAEAAVAATEE